MAKTHRYIIFIVFFLSIGLGYIMGFFLHGRFVDYRVRHKIFNLSDLIIPTDSLYNFYTGKTINLYDTLSKKEHNLLIFWTPTCSYSKDFFLNQLNEKIVGIYCFPLTDDLEYLNFYIDNHNITLPQLMLKNSEMIEPVPATSIVATPTFVVVDRNGNSLSKYVGINETNNMIEFLYSKTNIN